ncbi:MAG: methylenetetrahydrofolate reductase [Acidimicrobiaceae bacterium]|jgi:methylenetetrahydrofolate reductase (NADPH)|nr:methylenetetrahydrofolate reductase [Acidimicrobiaceae bacterium]
MARINHLLAAGRTFSFEFFPPRTDSAQLSLGRTIAELEPLRPSFVSVTYGAGGSTRQRTHEVVTWVRRETDITPMAHLTCHAHTHDDIASILDAYRDAGVENILALGGDPPEGYEASASDFDYANELVDDVRRAGDFAVGVAAHPEVHPRSPNREVDREFLAAKLQIADFAITQFFFSADHWSRLVDELAALGCYKPVIPGIMPVANAAQVSRMAALSGAEFPAALAERLAAATDADEARHVGVEVATELSAELLERGAPGLHFYTLNRSTATREIYANLGLPVA